MRRCILVLLIEPVGNTLEKFLLLLKLHLVMISDDIAHLCQNFITLDTCEMKETFVALCSRGALVLGEQCIELHSYKRRIDHLVLCITGMNINTCDLNLAGCSIEILILDLAECSAINSECNLCTEVCHIKKIRTFSDFLIRCEAEQNLAVLYFRMSKEVLCHGHDLGISRLVIRTEKRGTVGHQKVCADHGVKLRKCLW